MRYILVALLISAPVFAETVQSGTCSELQIRGSVRIEKTDMLVVMAEKTQSEKKLPVFFRAQPRLSPYINHYVQLSVIVDKDKILSVDAVKDAVPDALNRNAETEMKKVKEVKCPSL